MESGSRWKYCSDECGAVAKNRAREARLKDDDEIARLAFYAARAKGELPERQCKHCGKAFAVTAKRVRQKFCSELCFTEAKSVDRGRMCPTCGTAFVATYKSHRYCSQPCNPQTRKLDLPVKQCRACGKNFRPRTRAEAERREFCSRTCAASAAALKRVPQTCQHCGGEFFLKRPSVPQLFCSAMCFQRSRWKCEAA
jgi:hypothetical protein